MQNNLKNQASKDMGFRISRNHIEHQGRMRRYWLCHPSTQVNYSSLSLVILLHGAGSSAGHALRHTAMNKYAQAGSFLLLVPEGSRPDENEPPGFLINPQSWNEGTVKNYAYRAGIDDVGFLHKIIKNLKAEYTLGNIFICGFSNGAAMAFRLSIELKQSFPEICAIAPVCGNPSSDFLKEFHLENPDFHTKANPTKVLWIIGDNDPTMPLDGKNAQSPWGKTYDKLSVDEYIRLYFQCININIDNISESSDNPLYLDKIYGKQEDLTLRTIYKMGHHWPGGRTEISGQTEFFGKINNSFDCTEMILKYFRQNND